MLSITIFGTVGEQVAFEVELVNRSGQPLSQLREARDCVVETSSGDADWREVWRRHVRWSRTIRASRPAGHFGLVFTQEQRQPRQG